MRFGVKIRFQEQEYSASTQYVPVKHMTWPHNHYLNWQPVYYNSFKEWKFPVTFGYKYQWRNHRNNITVKYIYITTILQKCFNDDSIKYKFKNSINYN